MIDWRVMHGEIIRDFLYFLNAKSNKFILKGGISLMLCYGLTRFSEDIDLDGFDNKNFFKIVDSFIQMYKNKYQGISVRRAEDTDTVKRVFIHYGGSKPLKVEVSYRRTSISEKEYDFINNVFVYNISSILSMKLNAFNHRDKIRDLYDITFIYIRYKDELNSGLLFMLRDAVAYKGLEQFDYLIRTQSDELIDNDKLAEEFLSMYYDLGLS